MEPNPHIISYQMHLNIEEIKTYPIGKCGEILHSISQLRMALQKENCSVGYKGKAYSGIPEILEISSDIKHFISRELQEGEVPNEEERRHAETTLERRVHHHFSIGHHE